MPNQPRDGRSSLASVAATATRTCAATLFGRMTAAELAASLTMARLAAGAFPRAILCSHPSAPFRMRSTVGGIISARCVPYDGG